MPTEEQSVKTQICQWLELQRAFFWVTPNSRVRHKHSFSKKGVPDVLGIWRKRRPFYVEVKKAKDSQASREQIEFIEQARRHGAIAFFAFTLEDVINGFKEADNEEVER